MRPSHNMQACSSVRAMLNGPASIGRNPRLSMNAETPAFACALSPAMNTSSGWAWTGPAANTLAFWVLKALTRTALAGATRAISFAPNVSGDVRKPERSDLMGLVISTRIFPAGFSPYCLRTSRTAE